MKNKILLASLFFPICFLGSLSAQQYAPIDVNGRTAAELARQKKIDPVRTASARNGDEEDIGPGEDKDEGVYPTSEGESFLTAADLDALNQKIQDFATQYNALTLSEEQMQAELTDIKKSLEMCCGGGSLNSDFDEPSYIMQNAPNPFFETTNIQYFIPDAVTIAELKVRTLSGKVLKIYKIDQRGIGELKIERKAFESGSYVYTLEVDGLVTDSKIMILTK